MSANRSFRPSSKINNELWQKNSGNNVLVELIPSEANSVFISQDLTVGNTITVTSSEKLKDDIIELKNDDDILKLNPKKYTYKNDENKKINCRGSRNNLSKSSNYKYK